MNGLAEHARLAAFATAIRGAGEECLRASRASYLGEAKDGGAGYWTVRCERGDFIVAVENLDGMRTRVLGCDRAALLGARCWVPFRD